MNPQTELDGQQMPRLEGEPFRIAIDYDNTFTAHPPMFCQLIGTLMKYGCDVRFVTFRFRTGNNMDILAWADRLGLRAMFTEGMQKETFCENAGWMPHIWIDDDPRFIPDASGLELLIKGCKINGG